MTPGINDLSLEIPKNVKNIGIVVLVFFSAGQQLIASKIKVFVYVIYVCILCIFIMYI